MSIAEPFFRGQRFWSQSIDRDLDIYLLQGVREGTDTPTACRRQHQYIDPYWSLDYTIIRVRRPRRTMELTRHVVTNYRHGPYATPAGSP